MKAKVELTAEAVRKAIEEQQPKSLTKLAHVLGYKGSVGGSLAKKIRQLCPDINVLLKRAESAKGCAGDGGNAKTTKKAPKGKPAAKGKSKWSRDKRNVFRVGSSYGVAFDILAAHKDGLPRTKLVELLAKTTGKDLVHAGYDIQVVLSAGPNEDGLSNNDSPRHRSCRPGYWVKRTNGHVQLMVD